MRRAHQHRVLGQEGARLLEKLRRSAKVGAAKLDLAEDPKISAFHCLWRPSESI